MPQPEGAELSRNFSPILTNIAMGYLPDLNKPTEEGGSGFIAKDVFPNVPVAAPSASFNIWGRGDFLRREMKKLSNYEAPPIIGFATSSGTYSVDRYGVSTNWTAKDLADARRGGITDQAFLNAKTLLVTVNGALELEMQTAALVQTAANWTFQYTGVASGPTGLQVLQWDQAASDPVGDVDALREVMRLGVGLPFNTMIMPIQVFNALRKNTNLIDRIKYGGTMDRPTEVTLQQMKALFRLNILIPEGVYNTAAEGQTASYAYIWGKKVWLGYVTKTPSMITPSAGYHFSWTGDTNNGLPPGIPTGAGPQNFGSHMNSEGLFIKEYEENRPSARFIDCELWTTPNVTSADLGLLISAVIA